MHVLLLSDTHAYCDERILHYAAEADEVWHAGDIGSMAVVEALEKVCPLVRAVYGNIDSGELRQSFKRELEFTCEGLPVLIRHIWQELAGNQKSLEQYLQARGTGLFVYGHSHATKIARSASGDILMMNPGACGRSGFHTLRTMIRLEIVHSKVCQTEIIELGPRSAKSVG